MSGVVLAFWNNLITLQQRTKYFQAYLYYNKNNNSNKITVCNKKYYSSQSYIHILVMAVRKSLKLIPQAYTDIVYIYSLYTGNIKQVNKITNCKARLMFSISNYLNRFIAFTSGWLAMKNVCYCTRQDLHNAHLNLRPSVWKSDA